MSHLLLSLKSLGLGAQPLAAAGQGPNILIPILMVFAIFYVLVIRPQSKERRKREEKIQTLAKNTKVITNAGIHGTVMSTDEDSVTLRVDEKNNVRMKFSKAAIWQVLDDDSGKSDKKSDKKTDAKAKS